MKSRRAPATPCAGKYSSHLHANRPSDQLSRRTPCLTLVHEMSAAAHPLAPTLRRPDASNTRTQMERISLRACRPRTQRLTDALATSQLSTVAHRHSANPSRTPKAQKCLSLSPVVATLTHSLSRKSFVCHSYANTRDRGVTTLLSSVAAPQIEILIAVCFHGLTNPFSRNSFIFTSIQNPGGCTLDAFNFSRPVLASASSRVGRRIELLRFCPSYLFRYGGIAGLLLLAGIPANIIPCCKNWGAAGITGSRAGDRWEPWQRSIGKSWIGWNVASCN